MALCTAPPVSLWVAACVVQTSHRCGCRATRCPILSPLTSDGCRTMRASYHLTGPGPTTTPSLLKATGAAPVICFSSIRVPELPPLLQRAQRQPHHTSTTSCLIRPLTHCSPCRIHRHWPSPIVLSSLNSLSILLCCRNNRCSLEPRRRLEAPTHRRSSATSTSRRPSGEPLPTKPCPMGSPFVEGDRSEDHLMDLLLTSAWQPCHHGRL
jgi:hypothetical protein